MSTFAIGADTGTATGGGNTPANSNSNSNSFLPWQPIFLAALCQTGSVSLAAQKAGITRQNAYLSRSNRHRTGEDRLHTLAFAQVWREALLYSVETFDAAVRQRALNGVEREKRHYYKGQCVDVEKYRVYNESLLLFLAKLILPDKYNDPDADLDHEEFEVEEPEAAAPPVPFKDYSHLTWMWPPPPNRSGTQPPPAAPAVDPAIAAAKAAAAAQAARLDRFHELETIDTLASELWCQVLALLDPTQDLSAGPLEEPLAEPSGLKPQVKPANDESLAPHPNSEVSSSAEPNPPTSLNAESTLSSASEVSSQSITVPNSKDSIPSMSGSQMSSQPIFDSQVSSASLPSTPHLRPEGVLCTPEAEPNAQPSGGSLAQRPGKGGATERRLGPTDELPITASDSQVSSPPNSDSNSNPNFPHELRITNYNPNSNSNSP